MPEGRKVEPLHAQLHLPDFPKNAPEIGVGRETHGSIRAQEGEPIYMRVLADRPSAPVIFLALWGNIFSAAVCKPKPASIKKIEQQRAADS